MKVLLIYPPRRTKRGLHTFILTEPLGLEAIAACLAPEHEVEILDARLEQDIKGKLSSFKPEAVGIAASFTSIVYSTYEILSAVKAYNPKVCTFVGGNHATLCHRDFAGRADAVVLGEGELTTPELLRYWEQGRGLHDLEG